jgi:hypothetical protein
MDQREAVRGSGSRGDLAFPFLRGAMAGCPLAAYLKNVVIVQADGHLCSSAVRNQGGSAIWGGATLGLIVGLVLGFFVGSYWTTLLYAVLIGAAIGLATNVLAWVGGRRS